MNKKLCLLIAILFGFASQLSSAIELAALHKPAELYAVDDVHSSDQQFREQYFTRFFQVAEHYEELSARRFWSRIHTPKLLSFGDESPVVNSLRERLVLLGDLSEQSDNRGSELFDIELHEALLSFQKRHGKKADGILGPATLEAINVEPEVRYLQIMTNIQRQQLYQPKAAPHIHVNIPEYRLRLIEDQKVLLEMKTIVGRKKRKTPVFYTEIDRLVVNPDWNVPRSIAEKDIIPEIEKDPTFLSKTHLKVIRGYGRNAVEVPEQEIDLTTMYQGKNYQRFWEPPGEHNTLGKVKFLTTSKHAIYLHDTPAKHLFNQEKRAFSSGCIRVEKPKLLADSLMRYTTKPVALLSESMQQAEMKEIKLLQPIPLHVTYWTAWIDREGTVHFRDDPYRHDALF